MVVSALCLRRLWFFPKKTYFRKIRQNFAEANEKFFKEALNFQEKANALRNLTRRRDKP